MLVAEWRDPGKTGQPIILTEGGGQYQPVHVYVVWDKWRDLTQTERSEVIMDAMEEVRGLEEASKTTVAMGLTAEEADRMRIQYK